MGKIKKDSLGDRQKQYEKVQEHYLVPKMPFIIRVDGKAFHTYTRGFVKPFDNVMSNAMLSTMKSLCEDIPGAVFGYTQSDEITIVCKYTDRIKSQAWFGGRVEKIVAITASKATKYFNKYFSEEVMSIRNEYWINLRNKAYDTDFVKNVNTQEIADKLAERYADKEIKQIKLMDVYLRKIGNAEFDSRVFNIPEWDCINNVIWRQQDAIRNSIEAVGQANFSAKELHKITCSDIKIKLKDKRNIDWDDDFDYYQKQGTCAYKVMETKTVKGSLVLRSKWHYDRNENFVIQDDRDRFSELTGLKED